MKYILLVLFLSFLSCSSSNLGPQKLGRYQRSYKFKDISGDFILNLESGISKKNEAYVKKKLIGQNDNKEYEKVVAISSVGTLILGERKIASLRPKISQYTVWFKKQKYFSQLKVLPDQRELEVVMKSPEEKWNGVKKYAFEDSHGFFCFFGQIADCANITGLLKQAIGNKSKKMNITIIWEGYPFITEQYSGINGPFSRSLLSYEGKSKEGHFIFNLNFGEQTIFYHFNKKMQLEKKFWISQGLGQVGI